MSGMLPADQDLVATGVANLAMTAYVHDNEHGERRARQAAMDLAEDIATMANLTTSARTRFKGETGKRAATLIRLYG